LLPNYLGSNNNTKLLYRGQARAHPTYQAQAMPVRSADILRPSVDGMPAASGRIFVRIDRDGAPHGQKIAFNLCTCNECGQKRASGWRHQ